MSIRDGEPVDAELREAVERDVVSVREVERLNRVRSALQALPDLAPPDGAWEKIEAAARASRPAQLATWRRVAGVGIAAAVAVAAIVFVGSRPTGDGGETLPANELVTQTTPEPDDTPPAGLDADLFGFGTQFVPASYNELVAESARLDRVLRMMSYQRPMMSAATASTIVGLEDRIAMIDEQLTFGSARGLPQPQRAALWSERVELMNALVHVRFAQSQPTGF